MKSILDRSCRENHYTHFMFNNNKRERERERERKERKKERKLCCL
jgi:hypothetical protein